MTRKQFTVRGRITSYNVCYTKLLRNTYKELATIKTQEELDKSYFGKVIIAFGKSWTPNPDNPPFYCDLPFTYEGDELIVHKDILA